MLDQISQTDESVIESVSVSTILQALHYIIRLGLDDQLLPILNSLVRKIEKRSEIPDSKTTFIVERLLRKLIDASFKLIDHPDSGSIFDQIQRLIAL